MSRIYDALKKAEQETKRPTVPPRAEVTAVPTQAEMSTAASTTENEVLRLSTVVAAEGTPRVAATPSVTAAPPLSPVPAPKAGTASSDLAPALMPTDPATVKLREDAALKTSKADKKKAKQTERLQIFSPDGAELLGAEEFRRLRTKLQHAREKRPIKTLLITSALPGEGKTFIAVNLAQTFTMQHHARVLLIDADFRKPQVHAQLRVANERGLSDYLEGRCDMGTLIRRSSNGNLDYIVGGPVSNRPAELAGSARFTELLSSVADEYEWILIDTPPILPVTDASVMARQCDAVLLVVAAGQTPGDLAQAARKELQNAHLAGVVLNRATRTSSAYKNYYYYSYSHGSGKAADAAAAR